MATSQIHVTACDNELLLLAIPSGGSASTELLHYSSGFGKTIDVTLFPGTFLPTGDYTLSMIGISWGGPSAYSVTLTTDGVDQTYTGGGDETVGTNWTNNVPISVISGE